MGSGGKTTYGAVPTPTNPRPGAWAVVRRFGSDLTHYAPGHPELWEPGQWIGPSYWARFHPVDTLCGALLVPDHRGIVAMAPGTKTSCTRCLRLAKRHDLPVPR